MFWVPGSSPYCNWYLEECSKSCPNNARYHNFKFSSSSIVCVPVIWVDFVTVRGTSTPFKRIICPIWAEKINLKGKESSPKVLLYLPSNIIKYIITEIPTYAYFLRSSLRFLSPGWLRSYIRLDSGLLKTLYASFKALNWSVQSSVELLSFLFNSEDASSIFWCRSGCS